MSGSGPRGREPDDGEPLAGGNVAPAVIRVGNTVRKPAGAQTPAVHALLTHLTDVGFRHSPRSLGVDDQGRHVLEYVPGRMAHPIRPDMPALDPVAFGSLARDLHDALEGWRPPDDASWCCPIPSDGDDLVVHNDLAPWNVVVGPERMVIIDWDGAAPGTRTWDLAYAAHGVVPLAPPGDGPVADGEREDEHRTGPHGQDRHRQDRHGQDRHRKDLQRAKNRLRALADGYRLDEAGRLRLADTLAPRTWSMCTLLERGHSNGVDPWARLWAEGHGDFWRRDAEWIEAHEDELRAALLGPDQR